MDNLAGLLVLAFMLSPIFYAFYIWNKHETALAKLRKPSGKDRAEMTEQERWEDMTEGERIVECMLIRMRMQAEVEIAIAADREADYRYSVIDAEFEIIDGEQPRLS